MKKTRNTAKQYVDKNPIEQVLGIGEGVAQAGADIAKSAINIDNWDEYLGLTDIRKKQKIDRTAGDLSEGQELNLRKLHEKSPQDSEKKAAIDPGIDYAREIVQGGERMATRENREIETQLQEIMVEIKKLTDSSKDLQIQFKKVAVEQHTAKPGKYHRSFFAWMLSVIRIARIKVEDSNAWLAAMQSKKKLREYGAMAKKHGTTFILSGERSIATQAG